MDVMIVGGGPAGLAAATELLRLGVQHVTVFDREPELGGIPRHCHHTGFGWSDLRQVLSGPDYARERASLARDAGVSLLPSTTVIGWDGPTTLRTTSPEGLATVSSRAVLLATGCRERPRAARLVPGTRPGGIFTTGSLQQLVHLRGERVGRRAVVVGAEHVSYSAVHTLTSSGTDVVAIVTDLPEHQTFSLARWILGAKIPLITNANIDDIRGKERVTEVTVTRRGTEERTTIACDTVVFTGDWIPDHELARAGHVVLDDGTKGPRVDGALRTSIPGVFAAGNLLRGAERADIAAIEGRHAARAIRAYLDDGRWPTRGLVPIVVRPPLAWICPNVRLPNDARQMLPGSHFVVQTRELRRDVRIEARVGDRVLAAQRYRRIVPNRPFYFSAEWANVAGKETVVVQIA
jgi:thioredoxin reductase